MKSKSMEEHKKNVPKSIKFGIITLSDSKHKDFLENKTTDISGNLIIDSLKKEHKLVFYSVIPDDSELLLLTVEDIIKESGADVIITTGGTGIGVRDITIETLKPLFRKGNYWFWGNIQIRIIQRTGYRSNIKSCNCRSL